MDSPKPPSMRVLTRPPPAPGPPPVPLSSSAQSPALPSPSTQPRSDGVVVVGFISRRSADSSQLINRVIDSNVFGSGRMDKALPVDLDKAKEWLKCRRISYYHDEDKGMLFLQFCASRCPAFDRSSGSGAGLDDLLEEMEFGDLHGGLFMFSVCHVIIYVQEVSRFDTRVLKRFRVLQAAKQALTPYVKARTSPPLPSRSHSSTNRVSTFKFSSNTSPGRSRTMLGSSSSAISRMSGLGSFTSLLPGQCTPVLLFAFIDDFSGVQNPNTDAECVDNYLHNNPTTSSNLGRQIAPAKGSAPVVVLARPSIKPEDGFKKKLQSSLEAQIRFLIKRCRTLSGFEGTHASSRSGGVQNAATLFSLDASRAVVLLDCSTNRNGESLEFATGLVEDVLNGNATSDSLLLEIHNPSTNKDEILSVKEFITRQSDILRGRGGLVSNSNSSSASGSGMVAIAAAAAAAAASAASGKGVATPMPELPSFDVWLSSSQLILQGLLSAKPTCIDEMDIGKRKPRRSTITGQVEPSVSRNFDTLDVAVSWFESARGLSMKFSSSWCERALPAAKETYMKDLPTCYPTSRHEAHLKKAVDAFHSMVRGPAVQVFVKKLEEECTCLWKSGRQLCDAVSLTGKPCMHQKHDVETVTSGLEATVNQHSSGYLFLHACACGRARRLRADPFDFETANITFNCFPDCDRLLPSIQLPEVSNEGPIQSSSWSLIRVGGATYYDHSKGLLQIGFCSTQKFLFKWTLILEEQRKPGNLLPGTIQQSPMSKSDTDLMAGFVANINPKKDGTVESCPGDLTSGAQNQKEALEISKDSVEKIISFGRGIPNFTMKKPFAEVVAGSAATDSAFPPLQQRKQLTFSEKGIKKSKASNHNLEPVPAMATKKPERSTERSSTQTGAVSDGRTDVDPFLRIGSNVIPVNVINNEKTVVNPGLKHATVYVGFEHECPHGHRFLLNQRQLNQIGPPYSVAEDTNTHPSPDAASDYSVVDSSKAGRTGGRGRGYRRTNGVATATIISKVKTEVDVVTNENVYPTASKQLLMFGNDNHQKVMGAAGPHVAGKDLEAGFQTLSIESSGCDFSLLNRNLPLYMNCPYCKSGNAKNEQPSVKFAGRISQLQRIFLVTPAFPTVLATRPVIQFQASCLPSSTSESEQKLQFSLGCQVILPPESFLALRLPFVYGVQLGDGSLHALSPCEDKPEATAWIVGGTALQLVSKGVTSDYEAHT